MNLTSSERRHLKAGFGLAGLLLVALLSSGCSNHGPVSFYQQELFNTQKFSAPFLELSSTSQLTFTVGVNASSEGTSATNPFTGFFVNLFNGGGSSTYGPVVVTFFAQNTPYCNLVDSYNQAVAIAENGTDQEIPNNGTVITLERGYVLAGVDTISDITCSLQFWSSMGYVNGNNYTPVVIDMVIQDGIGETWDSQFTVYINT